MHQSFVNLNAVRRRAAAQAAAELEQKRLQQEQEQQQLTPPNQVDLSSSPSSALVDAPHQPPLTLISSASPPDSPLDNPVTIASNLLVRRYHTTANSKPSRLVHPQRVREEGEDDSSLSRMASGLAIDQVEEDDAVIVVERDGKLYRHGSLPARFEPPSYAQPVAIGSSIRRMGSQRSSARPPRLAARLNPLPFLANANSNQQQGQELINEYGEEEDEWEQALAEGRRSGGALDAEGNEGSFSISSSVPRRQRSTNFSTGSQSPTTFAASQFDYSPPGTSISSFSGHQQSQSNAASGSHTPAYHPYDDQISSSAAEGTSSGVRRHTSLTQPGTNPRIGDRLSRSPFPHSTSASSLTTGNNHSSNPNSSREASDDEATTPSSSVARRVRSSTELPPPTSPVRRTPWSAPQNDLLVRQKSWDDEQNHSQARGGSPLSPLPGSFAAAGGTRGGNAVSEKEMQDAFDALNLNRPPPTSLVPPPPSNVGYRDGPSPEPQTAVPHHASGRHSRSSSHNPSGPTPPRFASPAPGPVPSEQQHSMASQQQQQQQHHHQRVALQQAQAQQPFPVPFPNQPHPSQQTVPQASRLSPFQPPPSNLHYNPQAQAPSPSSRKLSLVTDPSVLGSRAVPGPASASAFVRPIGHSTTQPLSSSNPAGHRANLQQQPFTAMGTGWEQKRIILGEHGGASGGFIGGGRVGDISAEVAALQQAQINLAVQQALLIQQQQQQQQGMRAGGGVMGMGMGIGMGGLPMLQTNFPQGMGGMAQGLATGGGLDPNVMLSAMGLGPGGGGGTMMGGAPMVPPSPAVDMPALIRSKGYNPTRFDIQPREARFFVIKSYTEDDVQKSLKFEIWASTNFGNQRLERAFKESAATMPIYLFFSVNGSGHFAGMAQMITDVDYNTTSTVWNQDKWKGIFRVKWIYVRDVPNQALRHIKLSNTPEKKPVTNSRDTQELPRDAGLEMMRIFATYQSRTSLLQDYLHYEVQELARQQQPPAQQRPVAHLPSFPSQPTYAPSPYSSSGIYSQGGIGGGQQPQQRLF